MMRPPVVILGGGLAGLTMAHALRSAGVPFVLYESAGSIGGLASSHRGADGFSEDVGAHFITNRLAAAVGIESSCYPARRYGESVMVGRSVYRYPHGLIAVPRYASSAFMIRVINAFDRRPPRSAAEWFTWRYGLTLASEIAIPLAESWSGMNAHELSAAVGEQIPGSIRRTLYLKAAAAMTRRPVASGYCASLPESPNVYHVYPNAGVAEVCRHLAEGLEASIKLESRAEAIHVEDGAVRGVTINGELVETGVVASTLPIDALARSVRGSTALEGMRRLRFRPMIFVNLRMRGRGLLPDVVLWVPDRKRPFFRLTEAPLAMPTLAPEGKTTITADIGAELGDELWHLDSDALAALVLEHLDGIVPNAASRYLGVRVVKSTVAYPIFDLAYESERRQIAAGLPIDGLFSIGRNGEFRHVLMEDVYWRTLAHARQVVERWKALAPQRPRDLVASGR